MARKVEEPIEYLSGQDLDFGWSNNQLVITENMYHANASLEDMSKTLKRPAIEVLLLLSELLDKKLINERSTKMFRTVS